MNSPSNLNGYYEIIGPDPINVYCYQKCQTKLILVTIGTFLTFGILLVVLNWSKSWKFDMICRRCSVKEADRVLLQDEYGCYYETKLNRGPGGTNGESSPNNTGFYFTHQKIKYIFDDTKNSFSVIKKFDEGKLFIDFYGKRGLTDAEVTRNVTVFGKNRIDVDTLPLRQLILNEILNPFYLFQFYTVVIWIIVQYELYAVTVLILSIISLTWTIWEVRKQSTALKKKISEQFDVRVSRNNKMISLAMEDLVPGDCLFFACGEKLRMPCDAILLDGHCIVNEAMLTGESTPVTKTTAPKNKTKFDYLKHRDHILFRGSEVLQLTNPSKAGCELVVIRTGFYTEKGSLVRSILYPKPVDFRFLSDFYRFIPILLSFGTIGMFYSAYCWYKNGGTWTQIIFLSLDVVTWCVPPLLPSCMASISGFFQKYLRKSNVYCINSKSIYMASSVDTVCFDKTGTLTEDSLRLKGVYCNVTTDLIMSPQVLDDDSPIKITMGTCHSLCLIGGKIQGTPLEVEMFKSTGWSLQEDCKGLTILKNHKGDGDARNPIRIKKLFPFQSSQQAMTAIASYKDHYIVCTKGAPERIFNLCTVVPDGCCEVVHRLQKEGSRVLAAGIRYMDQSQTDVEGMARWEVEGSLLFAGLLVFENPVKTNAREVIQCLQTALIDTIMITGDSVETGANVARKCNLLGEAERLQLIETKIPDGESSELTPLQVNYIDVHDGCEEKQTGAPVFAVDGSNFDRIRSHDIRLYKKLMRRGRVFGRMLPFQKVQLIEDLRDEGRSVGMCGDGSNDCGALKVANFGVSLSSVSDASVAAPFTCSDIGALPLLIRCGRSAHVSAMAVFKYSVTICMSGFIFSLILFSESNEPNSVQLLYLDFILTMVPSMVYGFVQPSEEIFPKPPTNKLLSFLPVFSIFTFLGFQLLYYLVLKVLLQSYPWYEAHKLDLSHRVHAPSHSGTTLFYANMWTYVSAAIVFSWGYPYRKPFFRNKIFLISVVLGITASILLNGFQLPILNKFFHFKALPLDFGLLIMFTSWICLGFCYLWEITTPESGFKSPIAVCGCARNSCSGLVLLSVKGKKEMNLFEDNFWDVDLGNFNGFEALCRRMKDARLITRDYIEFLKLRAIAQETYGKTLIRIARSAGGKEEIGTLRQSWEVMKSQTEAIGSSHCQAAAQIMEEVSRLSEFSDLQREKKKQTEECARREQASVKIHLRKMTDGKKQYEAKVKEELSAKEYLQSESNRVYVQQKDVDKASQKLKRTRQLLDQSEHNYLQTLDALEQSRSVWEQTTQTTYRVFQHLEEERIIQLRNSMWTLTNIGAAQCVKEDQIYEDIRKPLEKCDVEHDLRTFVVQKQTGCIRPYPVKFGKSTPRLYKISSSLTNLRQDSQNSIYQQRPAPTGAETKYEALDEADEDLYKQLRFKHQEQELITDNIIYKPTDLCREGNADGSCQGESQDGECDEIFLVLSEQDNWESITD